MNRDILILRETVVRLTQLLAGKGLVVTQRGTNAYVKTNKTTLKPERVNIPYIPDNASEQMILAIQGFIDHEVAHILFTDWAVVREAYAESRRVGLYHNIVEDTWIEPAMGGKFPGAVYNIERLRAYFIDAIVKPKLAEAKNATEQLNWLVVPICRAWAGHQQLNNFLTAEGFWKHPLVEKFVKGMKDEIANFPHIRNSAEALRIARVMDKVLNPLIPADSEETEGDGKDKKESDDKRDGKGKSRKVKRGGATESRAENVDDSDAEREGDSDRDVEAGADEAKDKAESKDSAKDEEAGKPSKENPFEGVEPKSFEDMISDKISKDMIATATDSDYLIYSRDFDVIKPIEICRDYRDEWLVELDDRTSHMIGPMQKDIERMMAAKNRVVYIPGQRRGRMHAASLHKIAVHDDRIFRIREEHHAKDTAVALLVDNSGSMKRGDGELNRAQMATSAAYALAQTLERVKVANEVIGFTTVLHNPHTDYGVRGLTVEDYRALIEEERKIGRKYSRHAALYMPIYKSFDERLTPLVRKRFASIDKLTLAANTDGECVEIAAQRLAQRPEKRKILTVLSDGEPEGIGGRVTDGRQHLKDVVQAIERSGIEVIGIGIQTPAVKHYYRKHIVLHDLTLLPTVVMGQLKNILTAA